jgi:DNA-binding NarL/FixJ family response regulator
VTDQDRFVLAGDAAAIPDDVAGREAIVVAIDILVRELAPLAATFFSIDAGGDVRSWPVHGQGGAPAVDVDAVARRPLGDVGDDLALPIRDGERLVAGIVVRRDTSAPAWSGQRLKLVAALQPLLEMAYEFASRSALRLDSGLPSTLTTRQREVAHMLASGASNAEIARALDISADTAKSHTRAVLSKLGAPSRRELVMRLTRRSGARASVRDRGNEAAERILSPVLVWAAERLGAVAGGCALLSPRLELVAQAWSPAPGAHRVDPAAVGRVARQLFPSSRPSETVRRALAERPRAAVLDLGSGKPLLMVLRLQGRIAGVIWLMGEANATLATRGGALALRRLHPLLELACGTATAGTPAPPTSIADLADLGLTSRELTVARLALKGRSNADIATVLKISQSTVKAHVTRILAKTGVRSRTQLIALLGGEDDA